MVVQSLLNRKVTMLLTIASITVSVFILLSVNHIRKEAKASFSKTVSGVDLIVGARTGQLNLLLYSVFHIGHATNNISWKSYQRLANHRDVAWHIPISLGDSHKGYRVMGTSLDFFKHFKYGEKRHLTLKEGQFFHNILDAVIGYEIAKKLNYSVGDKIVLAHGIASTSFSKHDDHPFTIVGILKPTGTPVDQTIHVSLEGIEAIHIGWEDGVKKYNSSKNIQQQDLTPKSITAFMLGLKSKIKTFTVQRTINQYSREPLLAILPGAALSELWQMMGTLEKILLVVSVLVLIASLFGMSTMLLASMRERLRELAVLRAIGASPLFIFVLIQVEALFISFLSICLGLLSLWICVYLTQDYLQEYYGLYISPEILTWDVLIVSSAILFGTFFIACIPAFTAYRASLHSSLSVKH